MKKNFARVLIAIIALLFAIGGIWVSFYMGNNKKEVNPEIISAKHPYFESVKDLEDDSKIIIVATKCDEESPYIIEGAHFPYTMAYVEVKHIFKNDDVVKVRKGEKIKVIENAVKGGDYNYSLANYKLMEIGNKYLLFLYYSSAGFDDWFVINGVIQGKVSLNSGEDDLLRTSENFELFSDFAESVRLDYLPRIRKLNLID